MRQFKDGEDCIANFEIINKTSFYMSCPTVVSYFGFRLFNSNMGSIVAKDLYWSRILLKTSRFFKSCCNVY